MRRLSFLVALSLVALPGCGDDEATGSASSAGGGSASSGTGAGGAGAGGSGGGGGTFDGAFGSGTRLRAEVLDAGGDAQRFERFFDTELDLFCGVYATDDGYRCLPSDGLVVFLDDACTQPVIVSRYLVQGGGPDDGESCGGVPSLGTRSLTPPGCGGYVDTTYQAYRATGETFTVDTLYWSPGSTCSGYRSVPTAVRSAELAPQGDFVRFDASVQALDEELALEIASASDGAYVVLGARDLERDARCSPPAYRPLDGAHVCAPAYEDSRDQNGTFAYWAEGSCTQPAIFAPEGSCAATQTGPIQNVLRLACSERRSVLHERGAAVPSLWETLGNSPECIAQSGNYPGVALGDEIPTSTMPALVELPFVGDAAVLVHDARGARSIGRNAWRTSAGVTCLPRLATDGNTYCLSRTATNNSPRFADAACTQELIRVSPEPECELPLYVTTFEPVQGCRNSQWPLSGVRRLGDIHEGAYYLIDGVGACVLDTSSGRFARVTDEVVSFDEFPRLDRLVQ